MRNNYKLDEENELLIVTKVDSKDLADVQRVIGLGKPEKVINKFIEIYLISTEPNQAIADDWHRQHLLVEKSDPNEERKQVPVLVDDAYTYDDEGKLITEPSPNAYEVALTLRNELEQLHTWLKAFRGLDAPDRPEFIANVDQWKIDKYSTMRKSQYPDIEDFADAYVKSQNGDNTDMEAYVEKCNAVKALHPKIQI